MDWNVPSDNEILVFLQTIVPSGQKSLFEEFRDTKCTTKSAKALINEMIWVRITYILFVKCRK